MKLLFPFLLLAPTSGFTTVHQSLHRCPLTVVRASNSGNSNMIRDGLVAATILIGSAAMPPAAWSDEYGKEVEAPLAYTGEVIEICTKRGPLGACTKTETRTVENDNDKAQKYFKAGPTSQKEQLAQVQEEDNANTLIERLRQQSVDNKEKNDLIVARKTFENDQSAAFGPFDKQVLIMNTDEKTFTLLENPQAMRLKKAGFIEGRKFVKQPTEEQIEDALTQEEQLPGFLKDILGQN